MAHRKRRRRTLIIGAIIVALSVGIVFATLSYLQPAASNVHGSIQKGISHTVSPGNQTYPGYFDLQIPNITISENFYVGVSVTGGNASFCVLPLQPYFSWKLSYQLGQSNGNNFPYGDCVLYKEQISQDILKFQVIPGTWVIAALNTTPSRLMVSFSPA